MSLHHFTLVSQSVHVGWEELVRVAGAIQFQLSHHLPAAWGLTASIQPVGDVSQTPLGAAPIIVSDEFQGTGGLFGFHRVLANDPTTYADDQPYALVKYVPGLWSLDASHECLEMVINPHGNTMHRGLAPGGGEMVDYLVEICDPCGRAAAGYLVENVIVSDFVTRAYFQDSAFVPGQSYSAKGRVPGPRTMLAGGYLAWSEIGPSGQFASGDWFMQVAGQAPTQIHRPDIYSSLREGVDFQSRDFLSAAEKEAGGEDHLRMLLKKASRPKKAQRGKAATRTAALTKQAGEMVSPRARTKAGLKRLLTVATAQRVKPEPLEPPSFSKSLSSENPLLVLLLETRDRLRRAGQTTEEKEIKCSFDIARELGYGGDLGEWSAMSRLSFSRG